MLHHEGLPQRVRQGRQRTIQIAPHLPSIQLLLGGLIPRRLVVQTLNNDWLKCIQGGGAGTTYTAETNVYVKLHTGEPGSAGTSNASSVTTRPEITFATPTTGVLTQNGTAPSWTNWAGTNGEVVTHISIWDNSTAGTFLWSAQLSASKTVNTGDTLTLSSSSLTITNAS